jgi:hypothetical protein
MCYETYGRLLRARAARQRVKQSEDLKREEATQGFHQRPVQPVPPSEVQPREEEPA